MNTTNQTIDNLKIDLGLEQGELSFHKKHVGSTKQDENNCRDNIKVLKAKLRKLRKELEN